MDSVLHSATPSLIYSVAGFVSPFPHLQPATAILKHFRHKRQPLQRSTLIQRA
jgi:hypothetical protein